MDDTTHIMGKELAAPRDLPESVMKLLKGIETAVGKRIRFAELTEPNYHCACFHDKGEFYLLFDPSKEANGADVFHELLHLDCRIKGFPTFGVLPGKDGKVEHVFHLLLSKAASLIDHKIMFPKMLETGFDPYEERNKEVAENLLPVLRYDEVPFANVPEEWRNQILAFDLVVGLFETNSRELHASLKEAARKRCSEAYQLAEQIMQMIPDASEITPGNYKKILGDILWRIQMPEGLCVEMAFP